jgi:hypothetical protein
VLFNPSENPIGEAEHLFRNPQPQSPGSPTPGNPPATGPRIDRTLLTGMGSTGQDLPPGAGAIENQPFSPQPLHGSLISFLTAALPDHRPVPLQSQHLQGAQNLFGGAWNNSGSVEIFHSHQPTPPRTTGKTIAPHRRHQRTDVQGACRARSEAPCHMPHLIVRVHEF